MNKRAALALWAVLLAAVLPLTAFASSAPTEYYDGNYDREVTFSLLSAYDGEITEVILATNPDVEGEVTATYIARLIKPLGVKVTRIAHGVPVGSDLEYTDEVTLSKALEGRREMQ